MEFANDGDVFQKIVVHQQEGTKFDEDAIWKVFITVVKGLKALHDLDIMHRDLNSANVFLNKDGTSKLGDLNVSKVAKKGLSYTQTGTPYYASPEVWRDEAYDGKSDIWSLGCVLYEMIALKPPFRADNMQGLYKRVLKGQYPKISDKFSVDIQTIVRILLQVNPKKRPNCNEILNHAIVKSKSSELFPDDEDDAGSDIKNELLKTIYFPKGLKMNIGYLTDKLPKSSYDNDFSGSLTDRHNFDTKSAKSSMFPNIGKSLSKEVLSNSPHRISKKQKPKKSNKYIQLQKDLEKERKVQNSLDRISQKQQPENDKDLTPMEKLANRIEQEGRKNKNESPMNIDKEFKDLQEILEKQSKFGHFNNSF